MAQEEKNPRFSERVREQLLLQRVLVLDGPLDDDNGTLLTTQLLMLAAEDPGASPGGSVPSMLAIRDVMRLVPCDVSTLALGLACSAGQFLLSAGTRGKRFALPHARILMHRGSAGIGGSDLDWHDDDDDELSGDMYATAAESRGQVTDFYHRVQAHSDATIGELPLDACGTVPWWPEERRHPTLHTLLVHTIQETARHAGHADIIRESIDGAAGLREGVSNMPSEAGATAWKQHYASWTRSRGPCARTWRGP